MNHEGVQGSQEFIIEILMLSLLHHPNLMSLKGYCTDGDEKLLVYEYMPKGSLEDHLFSKQFGNIHIYIYIGIIIVCVMSWTYSYAYNMLVYCLFTIVAFGLHLHFRF